MTEAMVHGNSNNSDSEVPKPVILVVSYGTSCRDSRSKAIGAIENAIADAYPDYEVRRAFTSRIVINSIMKNDGEEVCNIEQALDKLSQDGVRTIVIQPTYIICGDEYHKLAAIVERYRDQFDIAAIGYPILTDSNDAVALAHALADATEEYSSKDTAIVFMGHGAKHEENAPYIQLQNAFVASERRNYFVGTIKSVPTLEDTITSVKAGGCKKVVLFPLMITAGNHAKKEMAGDSADSWKSVFEANGFETRCVLKGLGEMKVIQDLYAAHIRKMTGILPT